MSTKAPAAASSATAKAPAGAQQLSGEIGRKYKLLVQILTSDPRYAKALADVSPPAQHDKLSDSLINLSYEIGASLGIIKALIGLEFNRKHMHPFTILRVNSIVSKMIGKYSRKVGTDYLVKVLGNVVKDIYDRPDEDLEVEKEKMTGDDIDARVEANLKRTMELCQIFLERITSKVMIDEMPRQLRAICYFMLINGEQYKLDFEKLILPLVSGFVMLRFICPAITVPNMYGVHPQNPTGNVRKNLTLIAKVLQKLANGETFQTEQPALMPLNEFIERNRKQLNDYLGVLGKDPEEQEGRLPFADLQKSVSFEDLHLKSFDMKDLTFIHSLIYDYGYELIVSLQTEVILTHDKRPVSIMSTETDFLALIQDLGPPPDSGDKMAEITKTAGGDKPGAKPAGSGRTGSVFGKKDDVKKPAEGEKAVGEKKVRENLKGKSFDQIESTILEKTMDHLMKNIDQFDLTDLDQARFLYVGKPTKTNIPVFYLILHRLRPEMLNQIDKLMVYIYKTLQANLTSKYVLIIDLSWADVDDEMQGLLYRATVSFTRLFKPEHMTNCQAIYVLHPNFKTQQAADDILNIMPSDSKAKLVKTAFDWMDLSEVIEPNKIWIPFVSKKFTPLTYHLVKINKNDKRTERFMKITNESLLNIDAKTCTIQSEIMLQSIEEVRAKQGSNEIIIKYNDGEKGIQTRKYSCYTDQQREIVVEAIFEAGIRSASVLLSQTFNCEKENRKGKRQKRLVKLTLDSVLQFKEKVIKTEIPYSTIQSFYLDPKKKEIMYINYLLRGKKKTTILVYERADQMRDALLDAVKRFKFSVQIEKDLFYKKDFDSIMDKFFSASKSKSSVKEDDTSKWASVVRIDQPCKDLKKLFKKFKPGNDGKCLATIEHIRNVSTKLKLTLNDQELQHILSTLDKDEKGNIVFDDLIKAWVFLRREKTMIEKRRQAAKKRDAAPKSATPAAPAKK